MLYIQIGVGADEREILETRADIRKFVEGVSVWAGINGMNRILFDVRRFEHSSAAEWKKQIENCEIDVGVMYAECVKGGGDPE